MAQLMTLLVTCVTFLTALQCCVDGKRIERSINSKYGNPAAETCPSQLTENKTAETGTIGSKCSPGGLDCNDGLYCCRVTSIGNHGLCIDIDECATGAALCGEATCIDTPGSYTCSPNAGFAGLVSPGCPPSYYYNEYTNTCLRFGSSYANWTEAKRSCEADGEHLATFPTPEAYQWYKVLMGSQPLPIGVYYSSYLWIGLAAMDNEWTWQGLNNDTLSETDEIWQTGYPYELTAGLCGTVSSGYGYGDYLTHAPCGYVYRYICERMNEIQPPSII